MTITESIKFDKLQEENETLKKELIEKDKEIKDLEKEWEKLVCEKYDLQLIQLFKEDFKVFKSCYGCFNNNFDSEDKCYICHANKVIRLKDNSKYDKLPSKDVK